MQGSNEDYARYIVNVLKDTHEKLSDDAKHLTPESMFSRIALARAEALEEVLKEIGIHPWDKKRKYQKYEAKRKERSVDYEKNVNDVIDS